MPDDRKAASKREVKRLNLEAFWMRDVKPQLNKKDDFESKISFDTFDCMPKLKFSIF